MKITHSDREGFKPRPSTAEQDRRREANRCQATAPQAETPVRLASGRQCDLKKAHDGPHKILFQWFNLTFDDNGWTT